MGFFTPAWQQYDQQKAENAVNAAVTKDDQKKLARIACEAVSEYVRVTAVNALKDQPLIQRIAATDAKEIVREKAVSRITD